MRQPINLYLIKVSEFCNLNCPYCYMFNLKDYSYKNKPKVMSLDIVAATAEKVVCLAEKQNVKRLRVSLHGGEPLLAGIEWYRSALKMFRMAGGNSVQFEFVTQTNGVLLDEKWLDFFEAEEVGLGISIDGPRHVHDRYRVNFAGRGSYDEVVRGLKLALRYPKVFAGVLCVIDATTNGLETYRHFRSLGVDRMDFLWPLDHNWDTPPPGSLSSPGTTPYADYLIPIFDEWWKGNDKTVQVRYFSQIIKNIFGARGGLDGLGGNPVSITSIDSDGSIEPVDSLKACGDGFTDMGLNIMKDSIDAVYDHPLFQAALSGQEGLCQQCRACPLHDICGGGYLPHRYSVAAGFDNPTVYCRDLWKLTTHILDVVSGVLEEKGLFQSGLSQDDAFPIAI